ncbi:MAG: hypothetical protein U5N55_04835 [Cypionkella sp.]|nr:hypothetical protein [Cypionkella sp.]
MNIPVEIDKDTPAGKFWSKRPKKYARLTEWLDAHKLSYGVGRKDRACAIAAFNLAVSGVVNDKRPDCMSPSPARMGHSHARRCA